VALQAGARVATPVYVYGVVRSGALEMPPAEGVGDATVELIEHNGLVAVVSSLPEGRLRVRRRDLMRHLHTLEAAFKNATIVPCSFGTVLESEAAVETELLQARRDEILALLDRLADRVQMNVKVSYDEHVILREILAADPKIAALRERTRDRGAAAYYESIQLGELVSAALAQRRASDAELVLAALRSVSDDAVSEEAGDLQVLKCSFLVSRERLGRFDDTLDALAATEGPRLRFESFGPLPPTAFASLEAHA
jgi:hypothetical protein